MPGQYRRLKMLYAMILLVAVVIGMVILVIATGDLGEVNVSPIRNAAFIELEKEQIAGFEVGSVFSECVYSTVRDKSLMDACRAFNDRSTFYAWEDKYRTIHQISPKGQGDSMATKRMGEGYIPLTVSVSSLQDPGSQVLVKGLYTDAEMNVVILLTAVPRKSYYGFDRDPDLECVQIYTIFYLKPIQINTFKTLTFAIDRDRATG